MVATSIVTKIERKENPVTALLAYIGMYYLLNFHYLQHYEAGLTALHFVFFEDKHIPLDILSNYNKILEQYNNW